MATYAGKHKPTHCKGLSYPDYQSAGLLDERLRAFRISRLRTRYRISFRDALVLQAANGSGAEVLYSEDLSDGQTYGSVRVVNPVRANT